MTWIEAAVIALILLIFSALLIPRVSSQKQATEQVKQPPRITQVSYGRTINIGNFENVRIDFTAQVPENESYHHVLNQLKDLADIEEERIRHEFE